MSVFLALGACVSAQDFQWKTTPSGTEDTGGAALDVPARAYSLQKSAGAWWWGTVERTYLGACTKVVGDLDGDQYPDLAVGAPGLELDRVFFVSGGASGKFEIGARTDEIEPGVISMILGTEPGLRTGAYLAYLGDPASEPGRPLAVGNEHDGGDRGVVYLLTPPAAGTLGDLAAAEVQRWSGAADSGHFGAELSYFDAGDGPLLAIGAPGDQLISGTVWLLYDPTNLTPPLSAESGIVEIDGKSGDAFGSSLATTVGSDGEVRVLATAFGEGSGGAAYLLSGPGPAGGVLAAADATAFVGSEDQHVFTAQEVGDLDGDGDKELALLVAEADRSEWLVGNVGALAAPTLTMDDFYLHLVLPAWVGVPPNLAIPACAELAHGDLNGDRSEDLFTATCGGAQLGGTVYLLLGGPDLPETVVVEEEYSVAYFGLGELTGSQLELIQSTGSEPPTLSVGASGADFTLHDIGLGSVFLVHDPGRP